MSHYQQVSRQVFSVFREFTPVVEGLSLDEAFLDVTASRNLHGEGAAIARKVKQRIQEETDLTASVGVAQNKLVAKIASDLDKPDGLIVITPTDYGDMLDPLPVSVIPGIGKQTLQRLHKVGVRTIRDLRVAPDRDLEPIFGRYTRRARDRAGGIDNRPVVSDREEKSISAEETYDVDLSERHDMERELLRLADTTARRLRKAELQAGTVQIKIRLSDFRTFTRQRGQQPPVSSTDQIFHVARELLGDWLQTNPGARIRLLGVGSSKLSPAGQPDLFDAAASRQPRGIDKAADAVRDRFGSAAVRRARSLRGRE